MARKTKEEAEETRAAIVEAALDLFSERGYSATSFGDIAERIGMTRGAVYWHFSEKPELLAALMNEMLRETEALVRETVPEVSSFEDLKAHFLARTRIILTNDRMRKFIFFLSLQMEWSTETLALTQKRLREVQTLPFVDVERFLASAVDRGVIREDCDADALMPLLFGMWKGIISQHFMGLFEGDLYRCVEMALDLFVRGVRKDVPAEQGR